MASRSREVVINPIEICRTCLADGTQMLFDLLSPEYSSLVQHVFDYFKVKITGDDQKSTKLCRKCIGLVEERAKYLKQATGCQLVVNYLAERENRVLPVPPSVALNEEHSITNQVNQCASNSRDEIKSAMLSLNMIQSTSTSTDQPLLSNRNNIESIQQLEANSSSQELQCIVENPYSVRRYPTRSTTSVSQKMCPFCINKHNVVAFSVHGNIMLCAKHANPFTCLVPDCYCVFPNKGVFIPHYRSHLRLDKMTYLCRKCFGVLGCSKKPKKSGHDHQNFLTLLNCCSTNFDSMNDFVLHKLYYHSSTVVGDNKRKGEDIIKDAKKLKIEQIQDNKYEMIDTVDVLQNESIKHLCGSYMCSMCCRYFNSVSDYVDHYKKKHKCIIRKKEADIKFCPLCDLNYYFDKFVEHMEICTKTMQVGLNRFGCIYCKVIFSGISSFKFRHHFLFCKSFQKVSENNTNYKKCIHCTFKSIDDSECLLHANNYCIQFQLSQRYAMSSEEKEKVEKRMDYEKYLEQPLVKQLPSTSKLYCDKSREKLLKNCFNYLCHLCNSFFFSKTIFLHHLNDEGVACRSPSLVYCQTCVTDFESVDMFNRHLPNNDQGASSSSSSSSTSSSIPIKQEPLEDVTLDNVYRPLHANNTDVKVFEINNSSYFQEQEVSNADLNNSNGYQQPSIINIYNTEYQKRNVSNADENNSRGYQEMSNVNSIVPYQQPMNVNNHNMEYQEQDVSNDDINSSYAYDEMDTNTDDSYMQCEVEDKFDPTNLVVENTQ